MARMMRLGLAAAGLLLAMATPVAAQQDCNASATGVVSVVDLPGSPFSALPSADGYTIFVSLSKGRSGSIAVLGRADGKITVPHNIAVDRAPAGMTLSRDGKWLVATNSDGVTVFDTARLVSGDGTLIAYASDSTNKSAGSVYAALSPDDRLLFVSDENNSALTVYDFAALRGGSTSPIGRIPVGLAPVGLAFSPDGHTLYNTSEISAVTGAPAPCPPEGGGAQPTAQGELPVIDVTRAATNPAGSVLARVPGGCDPVRVAVSPDGRRVLTTARGENAVLVFDAAKLSAASGDAVIAKVAVGNAPVGVAVAGSRVFAANSNRFAPPGRTREWLSVIDARTNVVVGVVPAGLFPREMKVTADGKTLLVTNFISQSLELADLARLTDDYFAQQKPALAADIAIQQQASAVIQAHIKSGMPSPGTEAAVRQQVESLLKGAADYDAMAPGLANAARAQAAGIANRLAQWGSLKSITFSSITPQGMDVYDVEFEHASTLWLIAPLTPDGKISGLAFHPKS
jgi:YVTN family beta-propeller protein